MTSGMVRKPCRNEIYPFLPMQAPRSSTLPECPCSWTPGGNGGVQGELVDMKSPASL